MNIFEQFKLLFSTSNVLGAFLISLAATLIGGFFIGKKSNNIKSKNQNGDIIVDSKVKKQ